MSFFSIMDICSSGLNCEKVRMELIAQNIANIETTKTAEGGPYQRKMIAFKEALNNQLNGTKDAGGITGAGVQVSDIVTDNAEPLMVYDPQNPDANQDGYVAKPNINLANEIVDSISASRAYEANVTILNATKTMASKALTIGRG
jgi:flagellar basal-body rod protein FlgC